MVTLPHRYNRTYERGTMSEEELQALLRRSVRAEVQIVSIAEVTTTPGGAAASGLPHISLPELKVSIAGGGRFFVLNHQGHYVALIANGTQLHVIDSLPGENTEITNALVRYVAATDQTVQYHSLGIQGLDPGQIGQDVCGACTVAAINHFSTVDVATVEQSATIDAIAGAAATIQNQLDQTAQASVAAHTATYRGAGSASATRAAAAMRRHIGGVESSGAWEKDGFLRVILRSKSTEHYGVGLGIGTREVRVHTLREDGKDTHDEYKYSPTGGGSLCVARGATTLGGFTVADLRTVPELSSCAVMLETALLSSVPLPALVPAHSRASTLVPVLADRSAHPVSLERAQAIGEIARPMTRIDFTGHSSRPPVLPPEYRRLDSLARLLKLQHGTTCASASFGHDGRIVITTNNMNPESLMQIYDLFDALSNLARNVRTGGSFTLTSKTQQVLSALVDKQDSYGYILKIMDGLRNEQDLKKLKTHYEQEVRKYSSIPAAAPRVAHAKRSLVLLGAKLLDLTAIRMNESRQYSRYREFLEGDKMSKRTARSLKDIAKLVSMFADDASVFSTGLAPVVVVPDHAFVRSHAEKVRGRRGGELVVMDPTYDYGPDHDIHAELQKAEYFLRRYGALARYIGISMADCRTCSACMSTLYAGYPIAYRAESPAFFPGVMVPSLVAAIVSARGVHLTYMARTGGDQHQEHSQSSSEAGSTAQAAVSHATGIDYVHVAAQTAYLRDAAAAISSRASRSDVEATKERLAKAAVDALIARDAGRSGAAPGATRAVRAAAAARAVSIAAPPPVQMLALGPIPLSPVLTSILMELPRGIAQCIFPGFGLSTVPPRLSTPPAPNPAPAVTSASTSLTHPRPTGQEVSDPVGRGMGPGGGGRGPSGRGGGSV